MEYLLLIIFIGCCALQCLFFFAALLVKFPKVDEATRSATFPVSVIVASKNNITQLKQLLNNLYKQSYENFEIVVVNDRSDDGTFEFLNEEKLKHSNLKVVTINEKPDHIDGKKYALTLGIKAASAEHLLLTDADCEPVSDQWIKTMAQHFNDEKTTFVLGVSFYKKQKGLLNSFIRFETLWTAAQYIYWAKLGMPYMGVGRNVAYKKSMFLNTKGFNSIRSVTGGDDDLLVNSNIRSDNFKIATGTDALIVSTPKNSWGSFFRQKIRHLYVGKYYKTKHKLMLGLMSFSHLLFWLVFVILLTFSKVLFVVGALFMLRTLLFYAVLYKTSKTFSKDFALWEALILDFIYVFYYLSTAIIAMTTKRVRWS